MRRARRAAALAAVFFAAVGASTAFDIEDAVHLLQDRALVVEIVARVTENGREAVWNMELTEVTISGRAVNLQLDGGGLVVRAQFTPYQSNQSIVLVAQGQTWLTSEETAEVTYRSAFESLPVHLNEPVLFYPLGTSRESVEENVLNIELEIRVRSYDASGVD